MRVARAPNMPPQARAARGAPNAHARSSDGKPLGPRMSDAEHITRALRGTWYGHYGVALCPAHDNTRTPALSLRSDPSGHLLAYCHAGCSFAEVIAALRRKRIVMERVDDAFPRPLERERKREAERQEGERKAKQARVIWSEAHAIHGTPAETYLRASRHITASLSNTLRYHPECWHGPTGRRLPAMIARVDGGDRFAIHRTYLRPDGSGKADLPIGTEKLMLGACAGGHVVLTNADGPLVVAEGIETALSLACGLLAGPATIWAALSTSGLVGLRLPAESGKLMIATDGDNAGRDAGNKLAFRAAASGWGVSLLPAPEGSDWNDVLTTEVAA